MLYIYTLFFIVITFLGAFFPVIPFINTLSYVWVLVFSWEIFQYIPVSIYRYFIITAFVSVLLNRLFRGKSIIPIIDVGFLLSLTLLCFLFVKSIFTLGSTTLGLNKASLFAAGNLSLYIISSYLFRDFSAFNKFLKTFIAIAAFCSFYYWYLFVTGQGLITDRFLVSREIINPIAIAQIFGVASILAAYKMFKIKLFYRYINMALFFLFLTSSTLTGSKGPTITAFFLSASMILLVKVSYFKEMSIEKKIISSYMVAFIFGLCIMIVLITVPNTILERFYGTSYHTRFEIWPKTLELIYHHPLGIGTNAFASIISKNYQMAVEYPHNIFLEIFIENGWAAGIIFILFVFNVFKKAFLLKRNNQKIENLNIAGLLFMFSLLCASFSGSLINNSEVWAYSGMINGLLHPDDNSL